MAKPEDSEAKAADGASSSASNDVKANEVSASAETSESKIEQAASSEAPETPAVKSGALIIPVRAPEFSAGERFTSDEAEEATVINSSRWRMPRYAPLAAGIVLAVAVGAVAGAAALSTLRPDTSAATAAATTAAADQTRALQTTVAQLNSEVSSLKTALSNAQRSATSQVNKLTERLDRAEKAQAEPAAKLAKITETVDRLEKKQQQAAASAPTLAAAPKVGAAPAAAPAQAHVAAADPDITGSVYKEEARPPVAEGWRLVDFYQGRAVVESRNGVLFEVGPGSNLPGLGKVETIKRENGRVVVVAKNGTILASSEARRPPPPYIPYRY